MLDQSGAGQNGPNPIALAALLAAGVDRGKALKRLAPVGVTELWHVPLYLPTRFLDARQPIERFFGLAPSTGDVVCVGRYAGDFRTKWNPRRGGRTSPQAQGSLLDATGMRVKFSLFGDARSFQKALDEAGDGPVAMGGTLTAVGDYLYLNSPVLLDPNLLGHVLPQYPGKARVLSVAMARRVVAGLLPDAIPLASARLRDVVSEVMDSSDLRRLLRRPHGTLENLLWEAHLPASPEAGESAQQSLERLSALVTIGELRQLQREHPPARQSLDIGTWDDLVARVPFQLTDEQQSAVTHLAQRFRGPSTSATLINADVGMGKSIVYQLACAAAVRAGARVAVMLPNERLASQAHEEITRLFPELGALLITGKSRRNPHATNWLVGTTAMLFRDIGPLDICVVDEQHRFSVDQRRALAANGTHVVEISATPIPRTQALLLYGKLDVIRLTHRHSAQDIRTRVVERGGTAGMVEEIREIIGRGSRVLIVCPRREEAEEDEGDALPSVARVAEKWERLFPGRVRPLHGESDAEAAQQAFADMASGAAQIMVATTVVEVGLNIRDLRAVIIVHAERFGISQLHQLRGRLAREGGYGHCFLYLPRRVGMDAMARLGAMASTNDGFELAEFDMRVRGIGDVSSSGQRQHGGTGSLLFTRAVPMDTFLDVLAEVSG